MLCVDSNDEGGTHMARKRRESFEMALARVIALDELPERECSKCGVVTPPARLVADVTYPRGVRRLCRVCDRKRVAKRYEAKRDDILAYWKQRYENEATFREAQIGRAHV